MWNKQPKSWFLVGFFLLGIVLPQAAEAQVLQPFGPVDLSPDFDLFAPFVMDRLDGGPLPNEGVFFSYERLNWTMSAPKKRIVGAGLTVSSFALFQDAPFPVPNTLNDSLDAHMPDAGWAWGNRWELGYVVDNRGWSASVLNNVDQPQRVSYGLEEATDPLGTVVVTFAHPAGLMDGFIDVRSSPGSKGTSDGFADDLDGDGVHGPDGRDTTGDGTPDTLAPTDFDDLVTFLPSFDSLSIKNSMKINGVELMKILRFRPLHDESVIEFSLGARYLSVEDRFLATATGGTLGDSNWSGDSENHIVGPQLGLRYLNQRRRWKFVAEGRFLAGYNVQNLEVQGAIGTKLDPSVLNQPLHFNPTTFRHTKTDGRFSPVAEFRIESSLVLTKSVSVKVGWTGIYAGKIARGSEIIGYTLPEPGLLSSAQTLFSNGVNFGIEINR